MNCIKSCFEQKDYVNCYAKVESILLLAAKGEPFDEHILAICSFYGDDLDHHNLHTQLALLGTHFDGLNKDSIDIIFVIIQLRELTQPQKNLFSETIVLVKCLLFAPASNAISERYCSTLRGIKIYLRPTMTESRLNHWMMLNTHKEALGELSLMEMANGFCWENEARLNIFGKFSQNDIPQHFILKMSVATQISNIFLCFFCIFVKEFPLEFQDRETTFDSRGVLQKKLLRRKPTYFLQSFCQSFEK